MVAAVRLGEVAHGRVLDSTESIFRQRMADPDLASPEPKRTKTADPPSPIYSEAEEATNVANVANAVSYATEAALLANAANVARAAAAADEAKAALPHVRYREGEAGEEEEEEVEEEEEEEAQRTEKPEVEEEQAGTSTDAAPFSAGICEQMVEQLAEVLGITTTAARKKLQCLDVHSHHEFKGQLLNLAISQHYSGIAAAKR